jgi:hypothetical protein
MIEPGARLVSFSEDGDCVVALDDRGQTYRTRKGTFDWRPDPPRPEPTVEAPERRLFAGRRRAAQRRS